MQLFFRILLEGIARAILDATPLLAKGEAPPDLDQELPDDAALGKSFEKPTGPAGGSLPASEVEKLSNELLTGAPHLDNGPGLKPIPAGTKLDADGVPWDERIHGGGRNFYAKKGPNGGAGTWKLKRQMTPELAAPIKAELLARLAAGAGGGAPDAPPGGAPDVPGGGAPDAPPGGETRTMCTDIYTWSSLMEKAAKAGKTHAEIDASCLKFGVADLAALQQAQAFIPTVGKDLGL